MNRGSNRNYRALDPWEPNPKYDGEIRKCGDVKVLALFPEGEGSAQCWVWTFGSKGGSAEDREEARKQADMAAKEAGWL